MFNTVAGSERGSSILEMLVATAIIGTTGYFTAVAVANSMAAKKDTEVANAAAQFEEPLRTAIPRYLMGQADAACLGGVKQAPLMNKPMNAEYGFEPFEVPASALQGPPKPWLEAYQRCRKSWQFDAKTQTAHFCTVLRPSNSNRGLTSMLAHDDFTFVEVRFSLYDLVRETTFDRCSPPGSAVGPIPPPAGEFFGNLNRGYKMVYSIFAKRRASGAQARFDIRSGYKVAGANYRSDYQITRDADAGKRPGGKANAPDYKPTDVAVNSFKMAEVTIPEDAKDSFYPPPPDPCTFPENAYNKECQPEGVCVVTITDKDGKKQQATEACQSTDTVNSTSTETGTDTGGTGKNGKP